MIQMVLLVCLLSDPTKCHEETPAFIASHASLHSCMFQGQIIAAQWEEQHPKYTVRRWVCGMQKT